MLKIYIPLTEKKDNIVRMMKQNHTKHVYFSFFNPLKVNDEFEIESLEWVLGGELAMGWNRYKPNFHELFSITDKFTSIPFR